MTFCINVTGPLGSGKTHLIYEIKKRLISDFNVAENDIILVLNRNHDPSENPYFSKASDSNFNQFMNQLTISKMNFEQHIQAQKIANNEPNKIIIQDYSIIENSIYINEIHDSGYNHFTRRQYTILIQLYEEFYMNIVKPDLTFFIDLPEEQIWRNINKRGRRAETSLAGLELFILGLKRRFQRYAKGYEWIIIHDIDRDLNMVINEIRFNKKGLIMKCPRCGNTDNGYNEGECRCGLINK